MERPERELAIFDSNEISHTTPVPGLAAASERLANVLELGKRRSEQNVHSINALHKEVELGVKRVNRASNHIVLQYGGANRVGNTGNSN